MLSSQFHWWIYCEFRVIARLCCLWQCLDTWGYIWRRQSWICLSLEFCRWAAWRENEQGHLVYWKENNQKLVLWKQGWKGRQVKPGGRKLKSWKDLVWARDQRSWGPTEVNELDSMKVKSCKTMKSWCWEVFKEGTSQCLVQGLNCHKHIYFKNISINYLFVLGLRCGMQNL